MKKTLSRPFFSLIGRLTFWFSVSTFLLITITTGSLYWSVKKTLDNQDRLLILDKTQALKHLLLNENDAAVIKKRVENEWANRKFEQLYIKLVDSKGITVAQTPGFESYSQNNFTTYFSNAAEPDLQEIHELPAQGSLKMISMLLPKSHTLYLVLDRSSEARILSTYRSRLFVILLISFIIAVSIARKIATNGIQPVIDIALTAENITSTTLHKRISISNAPSELTLLVKTFNEMLDRLDDSFARLSRFSQDIAHDLRTPVNNMRGELEVALGRPRTVTEYQDVLGSCLEECAKLGKLIDSLLFLARTENPSAKLLIETVNLKNEVLQLVDFFETSAAEMGLTFSLSIPDNLVVRADRLLLQRAFANLITNAINYSHKKGLIMIHAETTTQWVEIAISDAGVGIGSEHLHRVFDRFYRVDESRTEGSGGTGLGLSIVQGIMNLHKGHVSIQSQLGQGVKVLLQFPA